jgi:hypothetical protein
MKATEPTVEAGSSRSLRSPRLSVGCDFDTLYV